MRSLSTGLGILLILAGVSLVCSTPALAQDDAGVADFNIDGVYGPHLPPDVSKDGYKVDRLINILHWFMGALFVGWGIFFVFCLVRFRQRPGHKAEYTPVKAKVSKWAEIGVAIFEAGLLIGLSIPIWNDRVRERTPEEKAKALHVRVIGEQFQWNFHYAGPDGIFGKTAANLVNTATNPVGLDKDGDPNAKDDVVTMELHIPVNRPIVAHVSSKDVIHSFFIPVMRVKQDAIPGMRIPTHFEAVKTGRYEIACAQLCGNNHYTMRALLVIESDDEYEAWLKEQSIEEEFNEDEFD